MKSVLFIFMGVAWSQDAYRQIDSKMSILTYNFFFF